MGKLLKNPDIIANALGVRLPIGSNTLGDAPVTGLIRFNSDTSRIEFYYNNAWNQIAKIGSVQIVVDNFIGDGSTTAFSSMSQSESDATAIAVFIGGVYQIPTTNYTVSGTTITFTSAPPAPSLPNSPNTIIVIHNINSTNVPA